MTTALINNKGAGLGSDISLSLSGPEPAMIGLVSLFGWLVRIVADSFM